MKKTEVGGLGERKIIAMMGSILRKDRRALSGLDDDAAIFTIGGETLAVTTDMGVMGTHFSTGDVGLIGRKIVTASVTDLLSKGATPLCMFACLAMPAATRVEFVSKLYRAMDDELSKYGAYLLGGDTNKAAEFAYATTFIGRIGRKPLRRRDAKAGDAIVVTGEIGNAAAGYAIARDKKYRRERGEKLFFGAQNRPVIDYAMCRKIWSVANAGIDVSDGLAFELGELARLSKKKMTIFWDRLPINPKLAAFCNRYGLGLEDMALHRGEDYQIVFTVPPEHLRKVERAGARVIGMVERGDGVFMVRDGKPKKLGTHGYEHFISN